MNKHPYNERMASGECYECPELEESSCHRADSDIDMVILAARKMAQESNAEAAMAADSVEAVVHYRIANAFESMAQYLEVGP